MLMLRVKALLNCLHFRTPVEPIRTVAFDTALGTLKTEGDLNGDLGIGYVSGGRPELEGTAKPAVHLPVEIIELIIWYIEDKWGTPPLRACSLVQKSWLHPARMYLFETVQFIRNDGQSRPKEQYQSLTPYMRQLRVVGNGTSSTSLGFLHHQLSALASCTTPRFCALRLEAATVQKHIDTDNSRSPINQDSTLEHIISNITNLQAIRCTFYDIWAFLGLIGMFPRLSSLSGSDNDRKYHSLSTPEILRLPLVEQPGMIKDFSWFSEVDNVEDLFVALSRTASVHTVRSIRGRSQSISYFKSLGHFLKASTSLQSVTVDIRSTENLTSDSIFAYASDVKLCSVSLTTFILCINPMLIRAAVNIVNSLQAPLLHDVTFIIHIWRTSWIRGIKRDVFSGANLSRYPLLQSVTMDLIGNTCDSVEFSISDQKIWLAEELSVLRGKHETRIYMPHARHLPPHDRIIIPGE